MMGLNEKWKAFRYAVKILYSSAPVLFILKLLFIGIATLFMYIPILILRYIINMLANMGSIQNAHILIKPLLLSFVAYTVFYVVDKIVLRISLIIEYKYNDEIDFFLDDMMIEKISSSEMDFFDSSQMADMASNSWITIYSIKRVMESTFSMIQHLVSFISAIVLFSYINIWIIPVILLLCIPILKSEKKINQVNYEIDMESGANSRRKEYYKNLLFENSFSEVCVYNLKEYLWNKFYDEWNNLEEKLKKRDKKCCKISLLTVISASSCDFIVFVDIIYKLLRRSISTGDIVYYLSLVTQLRDEFIGLIKDFIEIEKDSQEIQNVIKFMQYQPQMISSGDKKTGENSVIEFVNVSFRYPNSDEYVIKNCSFTWKCGEKLGLVGLNGSGKSTIVKLLCRLYEPTEGRILLDGINYKEYDVYEIRKLFGVLFQDYVKYSISLRDNIAISNINERNNDERLKKASAFSNVIECFNNLDDELDCELTKRFSQDGKELSNGQWQRIAVARAFFRNARFTILDEPSASLDPKAEHDLFEKVKDMSEERGALLISHNLSNVYSCDNILVLEGGEVVESGTHRELMKKMGKYYDLFTLQASKYSLT